MNAKVENDKLKTSDKNGYQNSFSISFKDSSRDL